MTGFYSRTYRNNKGFTLVELMIAMLLGIFLISGILQIFISSKQTYRVQHNLARLQENGRLALSFIAQDVRMAGYWGCGSIPPDMAGLSNPNFFYQLGSALQGFESTSATYWTPSLDAVFNTGAVAPDDFPVGGSDILTVRKASTVGFPIAALESASDALTLLKSSGNQLKLATSDDLKEGGITSDAIKSGLVAVISNCTKAEAFRVTGVSKGQVTHEIIPATPLTPGNSRAELTDKYVGGKVHVMSSVSYYVAVTPDRNNKNDKKNDRSFLYRRTNSSTATDELQLVDGVEQMQVLYGVDTDADFTPNYYVNASQVTANKDSWDKVISVRIRLLLASVDDDLVLAGNDPASQNRSLPYPFNDASVNGGNQPPKDKKIRRAFTTTIAIRNRLR